MSRQKTGVRCETLTLTLTLISEQTEDRSELTEDRSELGSLLVAAGQ